MIWKEEVSTNDAIIYMEWRKYINVIDYFAKNAADRLFHLLNSASQ